METVARAIAICRPDPARLDAQADAAMAVHNASMAAALPGIAHPHTPAEDRAWIRGVFARQSVWLALDGANVVGIASRDRECVTQLYLLPAYSGTFGILNHLGRIGLTVTLFLIGTGLNKTTLAKVGVRPLLQGLILWLIVGSTTLALILGNWIHL